MTASDATMEPTKSPRRGSNHPGHDTGKLVPMHDDLTHEHYWAAGFIEGEGCFTSDRGQLRIAVGQKFREPLERLQGVLGGRIHCQKYREFYEFRLSRRVEVDATLEWLRPLLSSRRQQQIDAARAKRDAYATSDERRIFNARKSARDRERRHTDEDFAERRRAATRKWLAANPGYREEYRRRKAEEAAGE